MIKSKILFIFLFVFLFTNLVNAELVFPQNKSLDLNIPCSIDGAKCSPAATCNMNMKYSNGTYLKNYTLMDNQNNGEFNITFTADEVTTNGNYVGSMYCVDGNYNGTAPIKFEINPTGVEATAEKSDAVNRGIYVLFGIAALLFFGFLFAPKEKFSFRWSFFLLSILFIVIGINIVSISIHSEAVSSNIQNIFDQIGAACYIMYWFIGGLMLMMWVLTMIASLASKKNMRDAEMIGDTSNNPRW